MNRRKNLADAVHGAAHDGALGHDPRAAPRGRQPCRKTRRAHPRGTRDTQATQTTRARTGSNPSGARA